MTVIGNTNCNIDRRTNWTPAYRGYLMSLTSAGSSSPTNTICMDELPEAVESNVTVTEQSPRVTFIKSGAGLPWSVNRLLPCTICIRVA